MLKSAYVTRILPRSVKIGKYLVSVMRFLSLGVEHSNVLLSLLMLSLQFLVPDMRLPGLIVRLLFI